MRSCSIPKIIALVMLLCAFSSISYASYPPPEGVKGLFVKYQELESRLEKSPYGIPLYIESYERDNTYGVTIYGVIDKPFETTAAVLQEPAQWCEIAPLNLTIKACTYSKTDNAYLLTLYNGGKFYQPLENTTRLGFTYQVRVKKADYLNVALTADEGPYNTRNHRMVLELAALPTGKTFMHFSYSADLSTLVKLVMKSYFATAGRKKVGFTVVDMDKKGNPVYIRGLRGGIERTAVRYYFAIQSYMDSLALPEHDRLASRLNQWYNLTAHFKRQLYEIEKEEYLEAKLHEYREQALLQESIGK